MAHSARSCSCCYDKSDLGLHCIFLCPSIKGLYPKTFSCCLHLVNAKLPLNRANSYHYTSSYHLTLKGHHEVCYFPLQNIILSTLITIRIFLFWDRCIRVLGHHNSLKLYLTIFVWRPKKGTLTNSVDPDQMPQMWHLIRVYTISVFALNFNVERQIRKKITLTILLLKWTLPKSLSSKGMVTLPRKIIAMLSREPPIISTGT